MPFSLSLMGCNVMFSVSVSEVQAVFPEPATRGVFSRRKLDIKTCTLSPTHTHTHTHTQALYQQSHTTASASNTNNFTSLLLSLSLCFFYIKREEGGKKTFVMAEHYIFVCTL